MKSFTEYLNEAVSYEDLSANNITFDMDRRVHVPPQAYKALMDERIVGIMNWKARSNMAGVAYLAEINSFDRNQLSQSKVSTKSGEFIFRYTTDVAARQGLAFFIKVNLLKRLAYFMTEESSSGETDIVSFESRGVKLEFVRMIPEYAKKLNVV